MESPRIYGFMLALVVVVLVLGMLGTGAHAKLEGLADKVVHWRRVDQSEPSEITAGFGPAPSVIRELSR